MLIARRRIRSRGAYRRSWLVALPVQPWQTAVDALTIELAPLGIALIFLSMVFVCEGIALNAIDDVGVVVLMASVSITIGALLSYLVPAPKLADTPPGSRYVPHRASEVAPLRPSLKALGIWSIRQMFASAQPKIVARTVLPILLAVPMGASAAAGLGFILVFTFAAGVLLLVSAMITTSYSAGRWLEPLPISTRTIFWRITLPPSLVSVGGCAMVSALLSVMGAPWHASFCGGLILSAIVVAVATLGCAFALARSAGPRAS